MTRGGLFVQFGRQESVGQILLRQLISLLQEGRLRPGDQLPPDRELAALLGISRPSVRQALAALGLIGIVESRQGSGTYLTQNLERLPLEPYLYRLLLNRGSFEELMEVRSLIEPYVAAVAARRASEQQLTDIRAAYAGYEIEVAGGRDVRGEAAAGTAFHQAIARAAGNQTFEVLLGGLTDLLDAAGRLLGERSRGASLAAHKEILEALLARDAERAERAMREHLADVAARLRAATEKGPA